MEELVNLLKDFESMELSLTETEERIIDLFQKNNKYKPTLYAAGKLSLAANLVVSANTKNLSKRIEDLEYASIVYNNEISKL